MHITSPQEVKAIVANTSLVYKVYDPDSIEIKFVDTKKIEKCLAPVLTEATYYNRGSKFATVEVHFSSVEVVRKHLDKTLRITEVVLLPSYMEQRISVRDKLSRHSMLIFPKCIRRGQNRETALHALVGCLELSELTTYVEHIS